MKRDLSISQWKFLVTSLTDAQLLESTRAAAGTERERTAWLVAHLAEVFRRDLALQRGYPSIYKYAREELKLSESQAWERVSAARLALEIPETPERIANGELTLDSVGALWRAMQDKKPVAPRMVALQAELMEAPERESAVPAPLLQSDKREMFTRVLGKSRRESEAALREWKEERGMERTELEKPRARTHTISFELTDDELAHFNRLRDLISHKLNSRDPKAALLWLIENGLEKVDPVRKEARIQKRRARAENARSEKAQVEEARAESARTELTPAEEGTKNDAPFLAQQETPQQKQGAAGAAKSGGYARDSANSRAAGAGLGSARKAISELDKRFVWIRDQGKCQFRDPLTGRICGATAYPDFDHILEVRKGGTNARDNLRLACRAHNRRRHQWGR